MAPGAPVVCSAIEHRAVLAAADAAVGEGSMLHLLAVNRQGMVQLDVLEELLRQNPAVVSVMWVNNEVGTVQPVREIAERCRAAGVTFHTDAVQALGKLAVRVDEVPADLLSISAHKLGGPKGVGALFVRRGTEVAPLLHGGAQERGLRAGTEDVAGAVGLATAAMLAEAERTIEMERLRSLRDSLEAGLRERVADMMVNGESAERSPTILNVSVPGADPEMLLPALDAEGLAVSSGSACSSGAVRASHVLVAMGLPAELAGPSVRFSLGRTTNREHIERAAAIFPGVVERLRAFAGA
jgi:cysteine desulfurase